MYALLKGKACWNEITSRYTLHKRIGENRSDIQDGNVYQNLLQTLNSFFFQLKISILSKLLQNIAIIQKNCNCHCKILLIIKIFADAVAKYFRNS